ncbi:tetratricopeptide repeat protein 19, mitochondrial isoform X3 [Anolis carolinensis]|uniref:tetratricopeptide repeat protein 19, mitochondrial isoform X3 n=1 Tax=Anolis carolinensis TaxID=28377 RepID=UPI000462731D|nr:PREDICTED: tetratricopeptide repeat protein 19, mitochondrial [Anolis carolinensis]|eukprot:XP_003230280.2 PREDICTED: tetratricopeptide repeat protein 19, mitochondrial [Anolis carolinensis]
MTLWRSLLLSLPRRGRFLRAAAAAGKRGLTQPGPRPIRGAPEGRRRAAIGGTAAILGGFGLSAFSLFSQEAEQEEKEGKEEEEAKEGKQEEEAIIFLLKKAKLSIMKGEMEEAERILHEAARMAQKTENTAALIYTYDTMANLALSRGQMEQAEKLFKATMSHLLAGNMKEDDNAVLEISLKLASIYAAQNQDTLALAGYEFCILSLEEKVARQKDRPQDALPEEERKDTRLLLGLSLDSYARFLLARGRASAAQKMYVRALRIAAEEQGQAHPQTVVLMNDLATALDAQGLYEEAYAQAKRAAELARETGHPEAHIVLNNLAGILMHKEDYSGAKRVYHEALKRAEKSGDDASAEYIRKELLELAKRKKRRSESPKESGKVAGRE